MSGVTSALLIIKTVILAAKLPLALVKKRHYCYVFIKNSLRSTYASVLAQPLLISRVNDGEAAQELSA